jgi:hypothetical protein
LIAALIELTREGRVKSRQRFREDPLWQFCSHKSVFFLFFALLSVTYQPPSKRGAESEMGSKADMSDSIGQFRFVPIADVRHQWVGILNTSDLLMDWA